MVTRRVWAGVLALMIAAAGPAACGDRTQDRGALDDEELERELELALEGDTTASVLEDTAAEAEDEEVEEVERRPRPRERTQPERRAPAPEPEREPEPEPEPEPELREVPTGTTFAVRLNKTLSTESTGSGEPFTATLSDPIVTADGSVLIPSGATVRGRVTAVDRSEHVGETAVIKLAFESVSFGGRSYPLQATVVEATPERRAQTGTEEAAKVAAGAAAGAVLGQVLGKDTESTLKGAAIGAATGTAIAMGTADVDAVLPSGSRMVIRLDAPVEVGG